MLKHLAARIPSDTAPFVAEFYIRHNHRFYVDSKHPIGILLRDAEKLYVEWKTNAPTTSNDAAVIERRQSNFNAFSKFLIPEAGEKNEN